MEAVRKAAAKVVPEEQMIVLRWCPKQSLVEQVIRY
jgi:hypothetical protein